MTDFVGPFELQLTTEHARQMESDDATVNDEITRERVKNFTLMENNSFLYLKVYNTWNIPSSHNKLLGPCYNCDAEYQIAPK